MLGADEHVVIHTRTHAKALILPALALILIGGGVGVGLALMPADAEPAGSIAVLAVGLVLVLWWVVVPYLRWWTTTYTVTNRRLITRSGILNKTGTYDARIVYGPEHIARVARWTSLLTLSGFVCLGVASFVIRRRHRGTHLPPRRGTRNARAAMSGP